MLALLSIALADPVSAVGHHATYTGDDLVWETEIYLPLRGGQGNLGLAVPLPADVEVLGSPHGTVTALRNPDGEVTGLELKDFPARTKRVVLRTKQPFDEEAMYPPLLKTDALQRVTLDGTSYEPDGDVGVYRHMAYMAQPSISLRERRALDRHLDGRRAKAEDQPIYLIADSRLAQAGGLNGTLRPIGGRRRGVAWFASALFAGLIGFFGIGYRALAGMSNRESVDAYIKQEFGGQGGFPQPAPDPSETSA